MSDTPTNVLQMPKPKDPEDNLPWFNVFALCLACQHTWIGTCSVTTSLFKLECPGCKARNSFSSLIPVKYTEALERASVQYPDMFPEG